MRRNITFTLVLTLGVLVAPGCSDKKSRGYASTTAPTTSGSTGGTNSGSTGAPITTTNPPPTTTLLTDTLMSSFSLDEMVEVDAVTGNTNSRWAVGDGPVEVVNTGTMAYVANAMSQDVTVVDRLANNVVGTVDVTSTPITGISFLSVVDPLLKPLVRPTGLAVTPNGNKIYSANLLNVTVIDGQTLTPSKSIIGLSSINFSQLLSNPSQALSSFLASPVQGLGMAKIDATNDHALATCMITGKVMRIDARTDSIIDYVDVGRAPVGIAIANGKAYVACALSQEIWVIDVATGNVVRTITGAGMIPFDVAHNQAEDKVYVANAISGDVSVIDTATDMIVDTLPAGTTITSLFQQAGLTIPSSSSGGISGLLNNFLQGFTGGLANPNSFGGLIAGGGNGGLLNPGALINGLLTAFLGYAGLNQSQLQNLSLPGTLSVGVAHNPDLLISSNSFTGDMTVTTVSTRNANSYAQLAGVGPADISPIWRR